MSSTAETPVQIGAKIYSPLLLFIYDFWVLWLSNTHVWKCPTDEVQIPLFKAALGKTHLDIGVGTGYIPGKAVPGSACQDITLVDLNENSLATAKARIKSAAGAAVQVKTLVANALQPLPLPESDKFDSISLFFLLHCLPGPAESKTRVFDIVKPYLAHDGVLVGSTILGREAPMNWVASVFMTNYNKLGIFDNWDDSAEAFERGLRRNFEDVEVWTTGRVCMFKASKPLEAPLRSRL